jgi:hypothetical protein
MMFPLLRRAGAELVGTYALVLAGCGGLFINCSEYLLLNYEPKPLRLFRHETVYLIA